MKLSWAGMCVVATAAGLVAQVRADSELVQRGAAVFAAQCARCHQVGEMTTRLSANWSNRNAAEFLQRIRTTMPAESPGSRSDDEYLAVTSYLLSAAAVPSIDTVQSEPQLAALTIRLPAAKSKTLQPDVDWAEFNGNLAAQRYSPLDQINAGNVSAMRVVWRRPVGVFGPSPELKNVSSPLVVNGVMYATVGVTRDVIALDAGSGELLWLWRAKEGARFENAPRKGSGRGVAYWRGEGKKARVFAVTPGYFLVALDAATGGPDAAFGVNGSIDLQQGLRLAKERSDIDVGLSFPPLVVNDVVVVGAAHKVALRPPSKANVKGDVRGFDARTGKLLWTFHTIPGPGEPGSDTWLKGSAEYTGNAGVWAPLSADPQLGLVYLPVEAATGDRYGGDRPGANLFANSLVALDVKTGVARWHYQIIHHDIWDWDNPSAPILAELRDGKKIVVQLTKQSFAYVFDRRTGKPVWPIREQRVPASDVPGEWTSRTQPFPSMPKPYDRQGFTEADLIDFTPDILAVAKAAAKQYRLGPLYTPPSLADAADGTIGTLSMPSATGGANWEGGAVDPETGILYVPSRTAAEVLALTTDPKASTVRYIQGNGRAPKILESLPLVKPPWGRITAIDLNSGEQLWWIANADTPKDVLNHPALAGVALPRTGIATRAGLLLTKSLLFAGEGWGGSPVLRAHDKASGKILAEIRLPSTQAGQPVTYLHAGKQYIAMFVGDGKSAGELVALSLEERGDARTRDRGSSEE